MSDQGFRTSDIEVDDDHSEAFNPLVFLADVAIQDAMQAASLQDSVMQDADIQSTDIQDSASRIVNTKNADIQPVNSGYTGPQDIRTQHANGSHTINLEEANPDNSGDSFDQVLTEDQIISMLAGQSVRTGPSPFTPVDSDDDDMDTNGSNDDAKGKGKAGKKRIAAERVAADVKRMTQQKAEEEQRVLEEMKKDEEMDRLAVINGAGSASLNEIEATGILPDDTALVASLGDQDSDEDISRQDLVVVGAKRRILQQAKDLEVEVVRKKFSLFTELSNYLELFMELAKHLRINDLVALYAISKDFNETLNGHLTHILKACAAYQAPESSRIFVFSLYGSLCIRDPVGRPDPKNPAAARWVPSLRWLRMVVHREKCIRDILACMAREGHRMPKTMPLSMKKMWLTMDIPTSTRRVQLMHNENYWTDNDLYNIQMLIIKLDMRFNDPINGPADDGLRKLMLGQRGLTPLCHLLKRTRFTRGLEALEACIRYSYWPRPEHRHLPVLGVPPHQVGRGHLEGWGVGFVHLYRPDELVMRESCRRNMDLKSHIYTMMIWGYVDATTAENIRVTEEEMYMSDDEATKKKNKTRNVQLSNVGRKTMTDRDSRKDGSQNRENDKDSVYESDAKSQNLDADTSMEV